MRHPAAISPPAAGAMPVRGVDGMAYYAGASAGQLACAKVRQAEWHLHPHRHENCAVCANTAAPAASTCCNSPVASASLSSRSASMQSRTCRSSSLTSLSPRTFCECCDAGSSSRFTQTWMTAPSSQLMRHCRKCLRNAAGGALNARGAKPTVSKLAPKIIAMCNCAGGCSTMLYCTVTGQLLETSVEAVKRHMSGKKYLRNKGKGLAVVLDGHLACAR